MKTIKKILIILLVLNLCSCSKKNIFSLSETNKVTVTRFSITDEKTGKRYSGIFNENKEILFYNEGIIYPFKGDFSYIHKDSKSNIVIDITGKTYASFELGEVYDNFYGYGLYSTYDSKNDLFYLIDKDGNKVKNKNIIDVSENIEIIRKNKKMTYFNISNNSYLKNNCLYDICYSFYNGVAKVGMQKPDQPIYNNTYLYGLVDDNGFELLPCEFTYLDYRYPKYVTVSKTCEDPLWEKKPEVGMMDLNNNWIIEPKYCYILPITDSVVALWIVEDNYEYWALYDIVNKKTKKLNSNYTLIDNINLYTQNNTESFVIFYDLDKEKYGFINSNGVVVLNSICDQIEPNPDNGYWQVLINDKWMLFKEDEGLLDPEKYLNFTERK